MPVPGSDADTPCELVACRGADGLGSSSPLVALPHNCPPSSLVLSLVLSRACYDGAWRRKRVFAETLQR